MKAIYSLAITLPHHESMIVVKMKEKLYRESGFFNSKNSAPHISMIEFLADEFELNVIINYLQRACNSLAPFDVRIDSVDFFKENGTCFLNPNPESALYISGLSKQLLQNKLMKPHLSIGRKLEKHQMETADQFWGNENMQFSFVCNKVTIRKFDLKKKQYVEAYHIPLSGSKSCKMQERPAWKQQALF